MRPCPLPPSASNSPTSSTARALPCRGWPRGWPSSTRRCRGTGCRAAGLPKSPARREAGSPPSRASSWPPRCTRDGGWRTSTRLAHSPRATGLRWAYTTDCGWCAPTSRRAAPGAPTCCCAAAPLGWWCSTGRRRCRARWRCDWCGWPAPVMPPSCCSRATASTRAWPARCSCACSARVPSGAPNRSTSPRESRAKPLPRPLRRCGLDCGG